MFIDIEATRQRLADETEELDGLFTSLGYREGLYWVENDASKGELEFVSDKKFYRTLNERGEGSCDPYDRRCNYVPMDKLYNQLGLGPVFKKVLVGRTQADFPYHAIACFEQGFVDAVRECYEVIFGSEPEEDEDNVAQAQNE